MKHMYASIFIFHSDICLPACCEQDQNRTRDQASIREEGASQEGRTKEGGSTKVEGCSSCHIGWLGLRLASMFYIMMGCSGVTGMFEVLQGGYMARSG
jgi:hypothetical protein